MAQQVDSAIDESLDHEERACRALEAIADALTQWCKLEAQRFEKEYPVKVPRDAVVTHILSYEERLRESQGESQEPLDQWQTDVGPRETEFLKKKQ